MSSRETRRVVVVSSDYAGALRIKTAVPFTAATAAKKGKFWLVPIAPSALNGLTKDTVADVLQIRGLSTDRFARRLGSLSETDMAEICAALALAIELDV